MISNGKLLIQVERVGAFARRTVGWLVSRTAPAGIVLDALEQVLHQHQLGTGLIRHSDRGTQYQSSRHIERLAETETNRLMLVSGTVKTLLCCNDHWAVRGRRQSPSRPLAQFRRRGICHPRQGHLAQQPVRVIVRMSCYRRSRQIFTRLWKDRVWPQK